MNRALMLPVNRGYHLLIVARLKSVYNKIQRKVSFNVYQGRKPTKKMKTYDGKKSTLLRQRDGICQPQYKLKVRKKCT